MSIFSHYSRGGQVSMHKVRMIRQIIMVSLTISSFVGVGTTVFTSFKQIPAYAWRDVGAYIKAHGVITMNFMMPEKATQGVVLRNGQTRTVRSIDIINNRVIHKEMDGIEAVFLTNIGSGLLAAAGSFILMLILFVLRGRAHFKKQHHRGNQIVPLKMLRRLIKKARLASFFRIGGLPLIKNKETSHMLFTGTTGAGKSTAIHALLPQIQAMGQRAVILDLTGEYVSRYYRPGKDLILNPFDVRSQTWDMWAECETPAHFDALAESIFPEDDRSRDSFWGDTGRTLLRLSLQKLEENGMRDPKLLFHLLTRTEIEDFQLFFKGTEASSYTRKEAEKTALSVKATLATHVSAFQHLKCPTPGTGFSVRNWVRESALLSDHKINHPVPDQWLFLLSLPDQRKTLKPLLSTWMDVAILSLMSASPNPDRRLWFILDELPTLQRLPSLIRGLAEIRKYGGAIVGGMQSIPQLEETYGRAQGQNMLNLFNTFFFFRNNDPTTASWISKVIGEAENTQTQENLSYGANTMRDGVSLNTITRTSPLLLPTEISSLPDLSCIVKLPGEFPVTRLKIPYQLCKSSEKAFVEEHVPKQTPEQKKQLEDLLHAMLPKKGEKKAETSDKNENELKGENDGEQEPQKEIKILKKSSKNKKELTMV